MPKGKDEDKRKKIISRGKRLFADPTDKESSLRELARLTEISPSSLYTYFETKESLIGDIVEESWRWMQKEMAYETERAKGSEDVGRAFNGAILSELLADKNLASLIVRFPNAIKGMDEKMGLFHAIIGPMLQKSLGDGLGAKLDEQERKARTVILVLGSLCAAYFSEWADLPFSDKDVLQAFRSFLPLAEKRGD